MNELLTDRLRSVKAISFDGDMTLWDFHKAMRQALGMALARLHEAVPGPAAEALTVDSMIEMRDAVARELEGTGVTLEEIRYQAFVRTLAMARSADRELAAELNAIYRKHRFEDIELYPDTVSVLGTLQPHYVVGLLSNGNTDPEQCGLSGRLAFTVFAQDVGVEKPAPEIFEIACRCAGCRPEDLMHVGDSLECDVQGANAVGAVSVWLNMDGVPNTRGIVPDYEIRSLTELLGILKREA